MSTAFFAGSDRVIRSLGMAHKRTRPPILIGALTGALLSAALVAHQATPRAVDGDTIDWGWRLRLEPARYRLAGIDTPETRGAKCAEEKARGKAATERLRRLLAGGSVSLSVQRARDKYGRGVASLSHDGRDVSETLIAEGLARRYDGRTRRASWCLH